MSAKTGSKLVIRYWTGVPWPTRLSPLPLVGLAVHGELFVVAAGIIGTAEIFCGKNLDGRPRGENASFGEHSALTATQLLLSAN